MRVAVDNHVAQKRQQLGRSIAPSLEGEKLGRRVYHRRRRRGKSAVAATAVAAITPIARLNLIIKFGLPLPRFNIPKWEDEDFNIGADKSETLGSG